MATRSMERYSILLTIRENASNDQKDIISSLSGWLPSKRQSVAKDVEQRETLHTTVETVKSYSHMENSMESL